MRKEIAVPTTTLRTSRRTGMFRIAFALMAAALLMAGLGLAAQGPAAASASDEMQFVQLINQARAAQGLNGLQVHGELTAEARSWSASMAAADTLSHTGDMTAGITAPWIVLGENVGVHTIHDVPGLFDAFMNSPSHHANLMDPRFQYVGVGVVNAQNGKLWTTHRFMATVEPPSEPATTTTPTTITAPTTTQATTPTSEAAATVSTTAHSTVPSTAPSTAPSTRPPASTGPTAPAPPTGPPAPDDLAMAAPVPAPGTALRLWTAWHLAAGPVVAYLQRLLL